MTEKIRELTLLPQPLLPTLVCILGLVLSTCADADEPQGLVYSGRIHWEPNTGSVTFQSSGSMPDTLEGFHWVVPDTVRKIIIEQGVTVTGAFRVPYRESNNPLHISGMNRKTSVIYGTDTSVGLRSTKSLKTRNGNMAQ